MSDIAPSSQLELLPDELFLDLFSYIPPIDLFHVWLGLNRRLNAILYSVPTSFDHIKDNEQYSSALTYFAQKTVFLRIRIPYVSLKLFEFPNLRSLTIDLQPTDAQLDCIRPEFLPRLERLTFSTYWTEQEAFYKTIFCEGIYFNSLRVCHFPTMPNIIWNMNTMAFNLRTMVLDKASPHDVCRLLMIHPTLRRLKVTISYWASDGILPSFIDHGCAHAYLIELDVVMNTFNKLHTLYLILSRLGRLRYLRIACDSLQLNDFQQLTEELNTRVPWLSRLNCIFKQTYVDDINILHRMNPLFNRMRLVKKEWAGGWYYYCVTTEDS